MEDKRPLLDKTTKTNKVCLQNENLWVWRTYTLSVATKHMHSPSLLLKFLCLNPVTSLSQTYYREKTGRGDKHRNRVILYPLPQKQERKRMSIVGNNESLAAIIGKLILFHSNSTNTHPQTESSRVYRFVFINGCNSLCVIIIDCTISSFLGCGCSPWASLSVPSASEWALAPVLEPDLLRHRDGPLTQAPLWKRE